jgi:hypothetical protein
MKTLRTGALATVAVLGLMTSAPASAALPPGNTAQQWNKIAEDSVIAAGAFQNEGLIYMAYVSAAVYDAVVAIEGGYAPYALRIEASPNASVDAAVIEASYRTLRYYLPSQAVPLDAFYAEALAAIDDGSPKEDGRSVGQAAATAIIEARADDGRLPIGTLSTFAAKAPAPGVWRLTPPFAAPQTPWVGAVRPFVLNNPDQFPVAPPAPLDSVSWSSQFNEIQLYGQNTSAVRTSEQTAVARFWTANVIRQYNLLAREIASSRELDLLEASRLIAMLNVAGADAQISVMHWKYDFLFWRPVTAIDPSSVTNDGFGPVPGFDDRNPNTVEESGWRPLITTPNHPEYPGAHGSITSAVAEVLTEFLGTDRIEVDVHGLDAVGALHAVRHFETADQLRDEIIDARLWAGLHYRKSSETGVDLGRRVAHYALNHAFRPAR